MRHAISLLLCACCLTIFGGENPAKSAPLPPVRVLIFSGLNNHNFAATNAYVKEFLEDTGAFKVDIYTLYSETQPDAEGAFLANPPGVREKRAFRINPFTAETLAPYDVILSNWTSWGNGRAPEAAWTPEMRAAYLAFVRNGKGHAHIHAGASSFYDWPEYRALVGDAGWKKYSPAEIAAGKRSTYHGKTYPFPMRLTKAGATHPATHGVEPFEVQRDELWRHVDFSPDVTVLMEGRSVDDPKGGPAAWEPLIGVNHFGKGRNFIFMLGHGRNSFDVPAVRALLAKGLYWAARGEAMP